MNNISENLFQSIDTIISQRLNEVQFDITVTGEVVDSSEAERGIYRVKSDNIEFSATGEPSRYVNGAQVYVTIPKGNYNNDKIIVGVVAKDVIAPLRYLRPMDYIIPFEKVNLSNINNFKETVAWNWKYLCLSTNINGNPISNYGLELWINDKLIGRFDSMEFFGDPYNPMGMNQQKLFKTNEPVISIEVRPYGDINAEFTDVIIAAGTPQEDETEPERLVIARVDAPSAEVSANDAVKLQAYHVHKDSTGLYIADKVNPSWYRYREGTHNFGAGVGWGSINLSKLSNLIKNGGFEENSDYWITWEAQNGSISQKNSRWGKQSLNLSLAANPSGNALAQQTIYAVSGHKYYGREYIKTNGELSPGDARFEIYDGVDNVDCVFGINKGNYPNWTMISNVITFKSSKSDPVVRTFTTTGEKNCEAWIDNILVIDLTEIFGSGKEPSKEWCDTYISDSGYVSFMPDPLPAPTIELPWTIGWAIGETEVTYTLDKFPIEREESLKAIFNGLTSNTLTLISPYIAAKVVDGEVVDSASRELIITINGKTNPVYNVYSMDNQIISNPGKQTLGVKFADGTSAEGVEFEYIYPELEDSMIVPIKEKVGEEEKVTNSFNLRSTYFPTYDSNTITVKANVNGYVYKGTITSGFGYQDNNGTQYRFNAKVIPCDPNIAAYTRIRIEVTLQDKNGNYFNMEDIVDNKQLEMTIWSAEGSYQLPSINSITWQYESNPEKQYYAYCIFDCPPRPNSYYGIFEIKLINWGSTDLSTYAIINSSDLKNKSYGGNIIPILNGPTRIVYSPDGMSASYDNRAYDIEILGPVGSSKIYYFEVSDNQVMRLDKESRRPKINYPAPLQKNNVVISFTIQGIQYYFPILCITNTYSNELLNSWSGKTIVDKEGNYIMSSLVGAGSKHEDNSFSGVLMGKVGNAATGSSYGIYGYNTGIQRFKLDANGNLLIKGNDDNYITLDELGNLNFNLNSIAFDVSDESSGNKFELHSNPLGHQNYLFLGSTKPGESYIQFDAYGNLSFNFESIEGKIGKMSLTINSLNTKIEDLNAEIKNLTLTAENANIKAGNTEGKEDYKLIINTSATGDATLFQVGSGDDIIKMSGNGQLTVELTSLDTTIEQKVDAKIGTLELTAKHINVTTNNFTLNTKQPNGTSGTYDVFKVNKGNHNVSFKSDGSFTINSLYFDITDNGTGTIAGWSFNSNTLSAPTSKDDVLQRTLISTGTGSFFNLPTGGSKKDLVFGAGEFDTTKNETKPFMVFKDGSLYASNAHITGEITATSGKIGKNNTAWFISENGLKYEDNSKYVATEVIFISGYQYVIKWSSLEIKPYSFTINIGINKTWAGSGQQNNSKYNTEKELLAAYGFINSNMEKDVSTTLDIPWTRFVNAAYDS